MEEIWPIPNWKRPCLVNDINIFRRCAEWCNTGLNPVTPGTSRWTACAFLEMRPNEKAWGSSIQNYVNAPFVDAGPFQLPAQSHMQGSILISIHTPQIRFALLTHTIEKHFAFYICGFLLLAHFRQSSNSLLHANYHWLYCTLCFRGQLPRKWG